MKILLLASVLVTGLATAVPAFAQFRGGADQYEGRGGWGRGPRGPRYPDRGPRYPDREPRGPQYPQPPPPPPPPQHGSLLNVHRFFSGQDHLLTVNANEGYQAGYQYEGVGFVTFAYPSQGVPKTPLYRCYVYAAAHFASLDPNCEGFIQEGTLGFVATQPSYEAGRQLVRCSGAQDRLVTTNIQECYNAGYRVETGLGYVP